MIELKNTLSKLMVNSYKTHSNELIVKGQKAHLKEKKREKNGKCIVWVDRGLKNALKREEKIELENILFELIVEARKSHSKKKKKDRVVKRIIRVDGWGMKNTPKRGEK